MIARWLLLLTVVFVALVVFDCHHRQAPPRPNPVGAGAPHSAPVGVQGGSLYVWSSLRFGMSGKSGGYYSHGVVQANGQSVDSIAVYSNLDDYNNQVQPALTMALNMGTPYSICAFPQNFKALSANSAGSEIDFVQAGLGSGADPYILKNAPPPAVRGFPNRLMHKNANPLQYLMFNTGTPGQSPPACATSGDACVSGALTSSCKLQCASCMVVLNY